MSAGQANVRTKAFKQMQAGLPDEIRQASQQAYAQFRADPFHPSLHNKPLRDSRKGTHRVGSRSVRITLRYRAIYVTDRGRNVWY